MLNRVDLLVFYFYIGHFISNDVKMVARNKQLIFVHVHLLFQERYMHKCMELHGSVNYIYLHFLFLKFKTTFWYSGCEIVAEFPVPIWR